MQIRPLLIVALLVASAWIAPSSAESALAQHSKIPASALTYESRIGTFRAELLSNYVSVARNDPEYLAVFQLPMGEMEILDVFVARSDFERRHIPGNILQRPMVQIQMFPSDMTPMTDANWLGLREMLPKAMAGEQGRVWTNEGGEHAKDVSRQSESIVDVHAMAIGDVMVYRNTKEGVRWVNLANVAFEGRDAPVELVLVTAAQRVGQNAYLVRLVAQVSSRAGVNAAVAALDGWLDNIWSFPNR